MHNCCLCIIFTNTMSMHRIHVCIDICIYVEVYTYVCIFLKYCCLFMCMYENINVSIDMCMNT